ncbi:hypothetical protein AOQ84DRAFT_339032 [Glonium stellatum]|uniref:tRNA-splicing endonuclease subunit Sen2 n=1 Tax=Glonium stellatum TaxID=574774 RepID=A0A8E2F300_9PEZI|nr:hypothetical protein AOQ84DRAFT_339032 [Glonium stellatum]
MASAIYSAEVPSLVTDPGTNRAVPTENATESQRAPRPKKPNYGQIHSRPLPLETYPLPAFIPHNPLSIFRIVYVVFSQLFRPPSSHPSVCYKGYFSHETQSVHVTDCKTIRALWEKGFFGKGNLSRSEPRWLDQEMRKRGLLAQETSEEVTRKRREERRRFKIERARKEREAIEQQLREEGKISHPAPIDETETLDNAQPQEIRQQLSNGNINDRIEENGRIKYGRTPALPEKTPIKTTQPLKLDTRHSVEAAGIELDEEHLQLNPEEVLFLAYGLGVLEVSDQGIPIPTSSLFKLFCRHSSCQSPETQSIQPDDSFLLKYVVYHHFRSLGWVVRPGVKFAVDYLLYNKGPVFSHAEFAVMIIPSYNHTYWSESLERKVKIQQKEKRDWWWLHRINRVQTQVHKSLVLVYVEIPPPLHDDGAISELDVGNILKRYNVREFALRRWVANRNRD